MWQLYISPVAIKQLQKLDKKTLQRIKEKISWYCEQEDPCIFAKKLVNTSLGQRRWRVGDWRIVFDKDDE